MVAALEEQFGTAGPVERYRMDGKTDPRIITDLLTAAGVDKEDIQAGLPTVYELMAARAHTIFPTKKITVCDGVKPLLAALNQRSDIVLGLLTGNIDRTAPLKLAVGGLEPAQFRVGAFGSDAIERNELPAIAMQRAAQLTGYPFTGEDTVIIGDTPADILCARAGRATAVAVASGWYSTTTLARYEPDHLLKTLSDTPAVLKILLYHRET